MRRAHRDRYGPQGAALVLELRKIQQSFDRELDKPRRTAPQQRRPLRPPPPRPRLVAAGPDEAVAPACPPAEPDRDEQERAALRAQQAAAIRQACGTALHYVKDGWRFITGKSKDRANADTELATDLDRAFTGELRAGLRVLIVGLGLVGGWAVLVPLSSAVVVPGNLIVETNVKKVQHPTGGVVAQIRVQDGSRVQEGDLMVRLDETQTRAALQVVTNQLDQVAARVARLVAERDGRDMPDWGELAKRRVTEIELLLASEQSLFRARASSRHSQKELLRTRISQLGEEIAGFEAQIKSKTAQLELIGGELNGVQILYDKQLVALPRLTTLQREAARLDGERGQLQSSIAEAQGKISESELQIIRIDQDFRTELMKELREAQDKQAELGERAVAARDQLNRVEIKAPTSGYVHQLSVHTVGGVVAAGEVMAQIVPDADELQVEAHVPPNEIDHVRLGQSGLVRFSAFNQRTTPQLSGLVSFVSADIAHDKQTNAAYYTVRVTLPGNERRRLGELQLIAGMPTEVFLQTGSRTMVSYLLKPITDQLHRSFNEP
jgi:HlyD family secretion protein